MRFRLIVRPPSLISQPQDLWRQGRGTKFCHGESAGGSCLFFLFCLFPLRVDPFVMCALFTTALTMLHQWFPWPWLNDYATEHCKLSCHQNLHLGKYNHFLVRTQAWCTETKNPLHNNESNVPLGMKKPLCRMENYRIRVLGTWMSLICAKCLAIFGKKMIKCKILFLAALRNAACPVLYLTRYWVSLCLAAAILGSAAITAWQCFCRLHIAGNVLRLIGSLINVTRSPVFLHPR